MHDDKWNVSMEDIRKSMYDIVDLMFLNEDYCHFRSTFYDVHSYCITENSECGVSNIMENAQKKAFDIIT